MQEQQEYDDEVLRSFLKNQSQLFDENVAETLEEAEAFLEDCMAVVVDSLDEVREYFEEVGADIDDMDSEELEDASEVFKIPDGRYLIVEG
ncbi:MAG: glyoxalase [Lachnospiraceae bacterium]